jgi:stage II sporulation protein P
VLAFVIGAGAYLLMSVGSWDKAAARLRQFTSIEWVNLLGWSKGSKPVFSGLFNRHNNDSQLKQAKAKNQHQHPALSSGRDEKRK